MPIKHNHLTDFLLILLLGYGFVLINAFPKFISDKKYSYIIEDLILELLVLLLLVSFIPQLKEGIQKSFGKLRNPYELKGHCFIRISVGITFAVCGCIFFSFFYWIGYPHIADYDWEIAESIFESLPTFLKFFIALPLIVIIEETIYRGCIRVLLEKYICSKLLITIISSIIFAVAHYKFGIGRIIFTFFMGLTLMHLYYKTNSLISPIITHYLYNAWVYNYDWYDIVWP